MRLLCSDCLVGPLMASCRKYRVGCVPIGELRRVPVHQTYDSNLVDPASSHTLVSKIKPCMCKYKQISTVKLRTAHYISYSLLDSTLLLGYP